MHARLGGVIGWRRGRVRTHGLLGEAGYGMGAVRVCRGLHLRALHVSLASIRVGIPNFFMTRFRLQARTCSAISVRTFYGCRIWKSVAPIQALTVPRE